MTDIPIIFSAPMVRALLAGHKTMTRRLAWRACKLCGNPGTCKGPCQPSPWQRVKVGDRLWVRENFWITEVEGQGIEVPHLVYDEEWVRRQYLEPAPAELRDGSRFPKFGHHPSIHMPRWASRITIVITATKVEPLQAISDVDAKAEGIVEDDGSEPDIWYVPGAAKAGWKIQMANRPAPVFKSLWSALHGTESWESNPDVVALSGRVILANIDSDEVKAA